MYRTLLDMSEFTLYTPFKGSGVYNIASVRPSVRRCKTCPIDKRRIDGHTVSPLLQGGWAWPVYDLSVY